MPSAVLGKIPLSCQEMSKRQTAKLRKVAQTSEARLAQAMKSGLGLVLPVTALTSDLLLPTQEQARRMASLEEGYRRPQDWGELISSFTYGSCMLHIDQVHGIYLIHSETGSS